MTFKQLEINDVFEFDHSGLEPHLRRGLWSENNKPFIKVSPRKYTLTTDTSTEYRVGTISVDVIKQ